MPQIWVTSPDSLVYLSRKTVIVLNKVISVEFRFLLLSSNWDHILSHLLNGNGYCKFLHFYIVLFTPLIHILVPSSSSVWRPLIVFFTANFSGFVRYSDSEMKNIETNEMIQGEIKALLDVSYCFYMLIWNYLTVI